MYSQERYSDEGSIAADGLQIAFRHFCPASFVSANKKKPIGCVKWLFWPVPFKKPKPTHDCEPGHLQADKPVNRVCESQFWFVFQEILTGGPHAYAHNMPFVRNDLFLSLTEL